MLVLVVLEEPLLLLLVLLRLLLEELLLLPLVPRLLTLLPEEPLLLLLVLDLLPLLELEELLVLPEEPPVVVPPVQLEEILWLPVEPLLPRLRVPFLLLLLTVLPMVSLGSLCSVLAQVERATLAICTWAVVMPLLTERAEALVLVSVLPPLVLAELLT